MNLLTKEKETHRHKINLWLPGEGIGTDFGKVMYTLLYLQWITNKDLLYSTWISSQCHVAALKGEGLGEYCKHVYVRPSPLALHLKLPQNC